jgi:NAD(P)-dependent dehydrogenase (short-subunit alcohol dehydrogenase family)
MLLSVSESSSSIGHYPELAGKRVLITGLSLSHGVDVARAFADHGCRLVLHMTEAGEANDALLEVLAQTAVELRAYSDPLGTMDAAIKFAQVAAQAYGGLDAVVNLIPLQVSNVDFEASEGEVEDVIADQFRNACLITRIAANRMRLTWTEGLILNIATAPSTRGEADPTLVAMARSLLASMTRVEAQQWADQAIRINAVAPCGPDASDASDEEATGQRLASEPDVAALALFLASRRGRELSGLVFDAAGAKVCC